MVSSGSSLPASVSTPNPVSITSGSERDAVVAEGVGAFCAGAAAAGVAACFAAGAASDKGAWDADNRATASV